MSSSESPQLPNTLPGLRRFTQAQFGGAIALLIGSSQMLIGVYRLDGLMTLIVGSGGGLLVALGSNLIRNRAAFRSGWTENGRYGVLAVLFMTTLTVVILLAAVAVLGNHS